MNKAAKLMASVAHANGDEGLRLIEAQAEVALSSFEMDDILCMMHADGSVNFIVPMDGGAVAVEAISAVNILKVLMHYRPFAAVFKNQTH
jgi:hypothetical protein